MAAYNYGTIYTKTGTKEEEQKLVRKHHPRLNRSDR